MKKPKIFALLVGVSDYAEGSDVDSLPGCIYDVESVEKLLTETFGCPKTNIKTLTNQMATRVNVIKHFHSQLIDNTNISLGDTVIFYFSGHGSYGRTAEVFYNSESRNLDETLMCYDSRIPKEGYYDLADKEIAAMVAKVKEGIQVILIIDSCHSGGATRGDGTKKFIPRYHPMEREHPRPLDSYLLPGDRFYLDMEKVYRPNRPHIKLAACQPWQMAYEVSGQGIFTFHLTNILAKTNGNISYRQLQTHTCAAVHNTYEKQLPDIGLPVDFDPLNKFIYNGILPDEFPLTVLYKNNQLRLDHGAIYGLPTYKKRVKKIKVAVYRYEEYEEKNTFMGNFRVSEVKLKESILDYDEYQKAYKNLSADYMEKKTNIFDHQKERYVANFYNTPPNLTFTVNDPQGNKDWFYKYFERGRYPFLALSKVNDSFKYQVDLVKEDEMVIVNVHTGQQIIGCIYDFADRELASKFIFTELAKIEKWERLLALDNEKETPSGLPSKIDVIFEDHLNEKTYNDTQITLPYDGEKIPFSIKVANRSGKKLFIGILHLSRFYGITNIVPCHLFTGEKSSEVTVLENKKFCIKGEEVAQTTDTFKIIVSTELFDDYKLVQKGIKLGGRILIKSTRHSESKKKEKDYPTEETWFTKTIEVKLKRPRTSRI